VVRRLSRGSGRGLLTWFTVWRRWNTAHWWKWFWWISVVWTCHPPHLLWAPTLQWTERPSKTSSVYIVHRAFQLEEFVVHFGWWWYIDWISRKYKHSNNHLMALCPDYPGEPLPEETFTHSHLSRNYEVDVNKSVTRIYLWWKALTKILGISRPQSVSVIRKLHWLFCG